MNAQKHFFRWGLLVLTAVGLLAACSSRRAAPRIVTEDANGSAITLSPGQELIVRLPSNPTTGYTWEVAATDENVLALAGEAGYTPAPHAQGIVGSGGTAEFRFQAVGQGATTLRLEYRHPWEQNALPAKAFLLQVTVRR